MSIREFHIRRTNFQNPEFKLLAGLLDAELSKRDGPDHRFYDQYNSIAGIEKVVLAYEGEVSAGCGALKPFSKDRFEIKRMYVRRDFRGLGVAQKILRELESWALQSGAGSCVLETGKRQPEAISFYQKSGYLQIENYGPYRGIENSLCFEKFLDGVLLNVTNKTKQ